MWPSDSGACLEIRRSRVQDPLWPFVEFDPGSPWFNFPAGLVNRQLVCLRPVGILNSCCCFYSVPSFRWVSLALKSPYAERSIKYVFKWSYDLRTYESNFCNCVEKPEKFRTSTGFEPVTSRFRCDALTNWANKTLTLGAGHLWVLMVPWGMNQWWNGIFHIPFIYHGIFHIPFHHTMVYFIYHFIIDSFLTGPLEPTNDQLPTSVAS